MPLPEAFLARIDPASIQIALAVTRKSARQLPDQSTTLRVESSSTDNPRLRGALPLSDMTRLAAKEKETTEIESATA